MVGSLARQARFCVDWRKGQVLPRGSVRLGRQGPVILPRAGWKTAKQRIKARVLEGLVVAGSGGDRG
eukprot:226330-Lingulodinium_polyedra.AAC.1